MKAAAFILSIALILSAIPAAAQECECGDVNCDGTWNVGDAVHLLDYLFGGGPPPVIDPMQYGNWDYHDILTVSDAWHIVKFVFGEHGPPICPPPYPPLEPVIDSSMTLYYTDWIPAGAESATIALTLQFDGSPYIYGISLPLRIRVDGQIPTINSIDVLFEYYKAHTIYPDSGYIAIGIVPFIFLPGAYPRQIARIDLTVPAAPTKRIVTLDWVHLTPKQAPTEDNSVVPMIYYHPEYVFEAVEPLLEPHCCVTPGDANMDGTINIADAVYNLQCVFLGCWGHPCDKHLDANCNGTWDIADVVHLINYIFKGGDPPCCL